MNSNKILIDRYVDQVMEEYDLPPFDPIEMAGMLLLVLEDIWDGDVDPVSRLIIAQMVATLKLHHADGVTKQVIDRMKR